MREIKRCGKIKDICISSLLCFSKYNSIFNMMEKEHDQYVWKVKDGDYREIFFFLARER